MSSFGIAVAVQPVTAFDTAMNKILEKAVRKLPPRKTGVGGARPSTWVHHLKLLRTKDGIPEADIERVMIWYAAHIGEEFVPLAFCGAAFRAKWEALERAASRDRTVVTVTPQAADIAKRVAGLGWPKGSAAGLPGAAQACLAAYTVWAARRRVFVDALAAGAVGGLTENEHKRLLSLGRHLGAKLPAPGHFVEEWLRAVHSQVNGWAEWSGELTHYIFKPNAKRFAAMGRQWAITHCNNAGRWDRFIEVMDKEVG